MEKISRFSPDFLGFSLSTYSFKILLEWVRKFKEDTQFIVITHNPRTMEGADWIYGVTMQEVGVSSIVGVEFNEAPQVA